MNRLVLFALCTGAAFAQSDREKQLLDRIDRLEKRLAELEARVGVPAAPPPQTAAATSVTPQDRLILHYFRDTTINVTVDGYYGYNFNHPAGRVNLLRAYDVISNSFSLNQAALIIERTPSLQAGRRFGARLDLQYGQATEAQQGSALNEPRPQAYRSVFQAYGTYIAPVGNGLTMDFGKFASSIGIEGNYTKDQINYSRSYWFNLLPFYHFGFRINYNFNDRLSGGYWLVNGIGQSEDFNQNKSQNLTFSVKPSKTASWTWNYYTGVETPEIVDKQAPGGGRISLTLISVGTSRSG